MPITIAPLPERDIFGQRMLAVLGISTEVPAIAPSARRVFVLSLE